jgi:hypothetical protein
MVFANKENDKTLKDVLTRRSKDKAVCDLPWLGTRTVKGFDWMTYKEAADTARQLAAGI